MSSQPSNFWRQRRVFVTGGTGLLGGWLVRSLLSRGAEVVCLVRDWVPQSMLNSSSSLWNRVRVVQGDLADQSLLERALGEYEISTVMHLAAQTIVGIAQRNPLSTFEANIAGTWKLMEACRRSPLVKQIVVASSDKAYGESPRLPYDETQPLAGRHPYDVSKSCADLIAQTYATTYRSPVCITRCGNLFGGGDLNFNRIVPGTIRSLLAGEAPIIRSDGKMVRDYFYIEDCVEAYLLLAERMANDSSLSGEAFNFSPDLPLTVLELVQHIQAAMGTNIAPVVLNQPHCEIPQQYLDSTKARERLGWKPLYSLPAALARTIEWYRQQYQREEPCARLQTFPAEVAARSA